MNKIRNTFYALMAAYLIFGSAGRVSMMLAGGYDLDALPFAGFTLGVVALVFALFRPEKEKNDR